MHWRKTTGGAALQVAIDLFPQAGSDAGICYTFDQNYILISEYETLYYQRSVSYKYAEINSSCMEKKFPMIIGRYFSAPECMKQTGPEPT